jgi:hypothetical protein
VRFSQPILIAAAAVTAMVVSAGAANARGHIGSTMNTFLPESQSYSGN